MVCLKENVSRIKKYFKFSKEELLIISVAILIISLVLSLGDWNVQEFTLIVWLKAFLFSLIIATISLLIRISCQKTYALSQGYRADFKVWWLGLGLTLILTFLTRAKFPIMIIGTVVAVFIVRQRLGEFRYGFSYWNNAIIALWGILGNLILAAVFAWLGYLFSESLFFSKGVILNLSMAFFAMLPFPQLDGMNIFMGSRILYVTAILVVIIASALLIVNTLWSLIIGTVAGIISGIIFVLISSEK